MTEEQLDAAKEKAPETPRRLTQEELDSMTYEEYLKFLNPEKSDEEIQAMVRKENRGVWMVRFELLALLLIIIVIIAVIFFT